MLLDQRQHKVFDSRTTVTPSTSVKKVISELEATLGLRNNQNDRKAGSSQQRCAAPPEATSLTRFSNPKTDVRTQTDREIPETITHGPTSRLPCTMESDSSFHENFKPVPPLTTVSVSTCPSCGSENVSSECQPTKRSASFQHLLQTSSKVRPCHVSAPKLSHNNIDTNHLLRSQSFTFNVAGEDSCHCRCPYPARSAHRTDVGRSKKLRKKKSSREVRHRPLGESRCLSIYPDNYWSPYHAPHPGARTNCYPSCSHKAMPCRPSARVDRSCSFVHMTPGLRNNYRYWDIDEWREQLKRDQAKKSERRALMTVSAIGIIVFICVSYFGTLLFLRITKLP